MKTGLTAGSLMLLLFDMPAVAHRLDEYLQATTISLEKDRVEAQIRLTPGVAVFPAVIPAIDTNSDGVVSAREQKVYAERVLNDLSLAVAGHRLRLQLISTNFPTTDAMREGLGEIRIDFAADAPGDSAERKLVFENHHQMPIATYLVNCLVPDDPALRVTSQNRSYDQARYQLGYVQSGGRSGPLSRAWWSGDRGWVTSAAIVLFAPLAVFWRKRMWT